MKSEIERRRHRRAVNTLGRLVFTTLGCSLLLILLQHTQPQSLVFGTPRGEAIRMDQLQLERARLAVEEYKVLHAEILQRNTILIQIAAGGMAAIVALIGFWAGERLHLKNVIWLIILVVGVVGLTLRLVHDGAIKAARRIIEIEEYVNDAVGGDDKNPLSWERRFGLPARGYVARLMGK
jgi:hypothetical protein